METIRKKKINNISEEELQAVKGIAGVKSGLVVGAKFGVESKFLAIPAAIGLLAATLLTGKETDKKVKKVINLVKESSVDKAKYVFEKYAIGAMGAGTILLIGGSLAPKPRKTATSITNTKGKNIKMKKLINLPKPK